MEMEKTDLDVEWEKRILCSDGGCIGVIGPDGRCKECGKPYDGVLFDKAGAMETEQVPALEDNPESEDNPEPVSDSPEEVSFEDMDEDVDVQWESRRLCSDGNCIGVIGPDGRCKECGKPSEG